MSILDFDPEAYWARREFKKWVVFLKNKSRQRKGISDIKIVRARTSVGAIKTAKANSSLRGRLICTARLATPSDLGCVEVKA